MGEKGKRAGMFDHPWEQHWESLRLYLTRHSQGMYRTYQELIRLLFEFVINREEELCGRKGFQTDCMKVIGDGDEMGKLIFFVPRDRKCPVDLPGKKKCLMKNRWRNTESFFLYC